MAQGSGVTQTELEDWEQMREDDDSVAQLAGALNRATPDDAAPVEKVAA